jgi:hypothetical protein
VKPHNPASPKTVRDFRRQVASEASCLESLIQSRWPEGCSCSRCGYEASWAFAQHKRLVCRRCRKETSPRAGTLRQRSHVPIQEWFWAADLVATLTPGIRALQLQRQLGRGSYRTAWFRRTRLRRGRVHDSRTKLTDVVEADAPLIGGPVKHLRGRGGIHGPSKSVVVGAVQIVSSTEKNGAFREKAGRLRRARIDHADEAMIGSVLREHVAPGAVIRSDGWRGYSNRALQGVPHEQRLVGPPGRAHIVAPPLSTGSSPI